MKAWLRSVFVAGIALVCAFAWPNAAQACTCVSYPNVTAEQVRHDIETAFDHAAAVFSGEVVSADHLVAVIRVEKVWKGAIGTAVRMRHATMTPDGHLQVSSCDYRFQRGKKYLVFAHRDSAELMYAFECGFTAPLDLAADTSRVLATIVAIRQGNEPDAYTRFLTLEQSWMKALAARDMTALEALLAPEFTTIGFGSITPAPVGDRAEWLRNAAGFSWPAHEVRLVKVHDRGDVAVVHCVLSARFPPKAITPEGGELEFFATDVWIKRGAAWQVLSRHLTLEGR